MAFDDEGQWSQSGESFAATRSFDYERGDFRGGARLGLTHIEHCMHAHETPDDAVECLVRFREQGGEPSLDDLEPKQPLLVGLGSYQDSGTSPKRREGELEAWDYGLVLRGEPSPTTPEPRDLLVRWENVRAARTTSASTLTLEVGIGESAAGLSLLEVTAFGEGGEGAWLELLNRKGVSLRARLSEPGVE